VSLGTEREASRLANPFSALRGTKVRRVVVLSQDSVIRDLSEVILKGHGFIVEQAEALLDVRTLVATRPVFACLVDCRRLTARGTKLLRQVAELDLIHSVALVDAGDSEGEVAAYAAGAVAVVACPFENVALIAAVSGLPEFRQRQEILNGGRQ